MQSSSVPYFVFAPICQSPCSSMDSEPHQWFIQPKYYISWYLMTIDLLIITRILIAFVAVFAHCLGGFTMLCMITSRSLSSSETLKVTPPCHIWTLRCLSHVHKRNIFEVLEQLNSAKLNYEHSQTKRENASLYEKLCRSTYTINLVYISCECVNLCCLKNAWCDKQSSTGLHVH